LQIISNDEDEEVDEKEVSEGSGDCKGGGLNAPVWFW
jgi:hypothetical protein